MTPKPPPHITLTSVLRRINTGFALMDSDFCFRSLNQSMARITGRSIEEHLGCPAVDILGEPHWSDTISPVFERALAGESIKDIALSGIFPDPSGEARHIYASCFGIQEAGCPSGVVMLASDVTDSLESEQAHRNIQEALEKKIRETDRILDRMADGLLSCNASWRCTQVNREAERLLRVRRDDLLGSSLWEVFPALSGSPFYNAAHRVQKTRQEETVEGTISGRDTRTSLRVYPDPDGGISIYFHDISRHDALRSEREKERFQQDFMRDVLSGATDGRLTLCRSLNDLPQPLSEGQENAAVTLTATGGIRELRKAAESAADALRFSNDSWFDFETSIGEAAMNAVVHAGGGEGSISYDVRSARIQVRITDHGRGIPTEYLARALLQKGFTTAGTMGQGFNMILQMTDSLWLFTNTEGTTVVLEKERR